MHQLLSRKSLLAQSKTIQNEIVLFREVTSYLAPMMLLNQVSR